MQMNISVVAHYAFYQRLRKKRFWNLWYSMDCRNYIQIPYIKENLEHHSAYVRKNAVLTWYV